MHVRERMRRSVRSSSCLPVLDQVDGSAAEGVVVHHWVGQQEHARAEGAAGCSRRVEGRKAIIVSGTCSGRRRGKGPDAERRGKQLTARA